MAGPNARKKRSALQKALAVLASVALTAALLPANGLAYGASSAFSALESAYAGLLGSDTASVVVATWGIGSDEASAATATLYDDGSLVFAGEGDFQAYGGGDVVDGAEVQQAQVPWADYREDIVSVRFEDGVQPVSLANYFADCTSLTQVSDLPDSVRSIRYAFAGCTALETAPVLNEGLEDISGAFSGCTALKQQPAIPDSVRADEDAFAGCTALEGSSGSADATEESSSASSTSDTASASSSSASGAADSAGSSSSSSASISSSSSSSVSASGISNSADESDASSASSASPWSGSSESSAVRTQSESDAHDYGSDGFCTECGSYNPDAEAYAVATAEDLAAIAQAVAGGDGLAGKTVTLTADIDVSGYSNWTPIGSSATPFAGTFDGDGHSVTGLAIVDVEGGCGGYKGLFGNNSGTVKDVRVSGTIGTSSAKITEGGQSDSNIGGVVGYNSGTVHGVVNDVTVYVEGLSIGSIGGVVGFNAADGVVEQSANTAAVEGARTTGGVAGLNYGTVLQCYNTGSVTGTGARTHAGIGGVVGQSGDGEGTYASSVTACYNRGAVSNAGGGAHGGIVGYADSAVTVRSCYDVGEVIAGANSDYNPIIGAFDGANASVANNYSLSGLAAGSADASLANMATGTVLSATNLKAAAARLNAGSSYYTDDVDGVNDGYPVLAWQVGEAMAVTAESTGDGTVLVSVNGGEFAAEAEADAGDVITVSPTAADGSYLAQVRWAVAASSSGADDSDPLAYTVLSADDSGAYTFTMPEDGSVQVMADFVSIVWDGTIDLTWYDPDSTYFNIQYAAQWAGAAAIVNGIFTTYPTKEVTADDGTTYNQPDYAAFKTGMGVVEETTGEGDDATTVTVSSEHYGEFTATYKLADSQNDYELTGLITKTTRVVGNPDYVVAKLGSGTAGDNNLVTTSDYWYGADDFNGKTIYVTADLDFGGVQNADGTWDTSSPLFMSLGGQYAMLPGTDTTNGYSKLSSSFNGTLDGLGHSVKNVYAERYAKGTNYGDSQSLGLVGRLGNHDSDDASIAAVNPTVRQIVLESGLISARRSVGGIVGKIGQTSASRLDDGSTGGIVECCINKATVYSTDKKGCGGIVGAAWNEGVIRYCANFGTIESRSIQNPTGGIAGSNEVPIYNCYNVGTVVSTVASSFGMAIGTNNGGAFGRYVVNCYWLTGTSSSGEGYYDSTMKEDYTVEFGEGTDTPTLTAELMNAGSSSVWCDDTTGINESGGVNYPILYCQADDYDPSSQYTVTVVQPESGGTISSDTTIGFRGQTVNLSAEGDTGYVVDYYTVNGEPLSSSSFTLDSDVTVSAVFREVYSTTISIPDTSNEPYEISVRKTGLVDMLYFGLTKVTDDPVHDGDTIYEGDVLTYTVTVRDGAVPDDPDLEYSGVFSVGTNYYEPQHPETLLKSSGFTYTATGTEIDLNISVDFVGTQPKSWESIADTSWYDPDNPQTEYTISTAQQLAGIAMLVKRGATLSDGTAQQVSFEGVTFTLTSDLSLERTDDGTTRVWIPIGVKMTGLESAFKGTFDGGGHTISGMTFDTIENQGLFGYTDGATIKNLTVAGTVDVQNSYSGAVVGRAVGTTISDVTNEAAVAGGENAMYIGGIVGYVDGSAEVTTITNAVNKGSVTAYAYAGGIAGYVAGSEDAAQVISDSTNQGQVSVSPGSSALSAYAGGIVGGMTGTVVSQCANEGFIVGSGQAAGYVGGLVGVLDYDSPSTLAASVNRSSVTGASSGAGGLVGMSDGDLTVQDCYNVGEVTSTSLYAGGLVGSISNANVGTGGITVTSCYSAGSVSSGVSTNAGAVAGYARYNMWLTNVHYLSGSAQSVIGVTRSISSSSNTDASAQTSDGLKALADTLGAEAWRTDSINLNSGYPMLSWELPYALTFKDSQGNDLKKVYLPEGYSASNATVASLYGGTPEISLSDGYEVQFLGWMTEQGGTVKLTISNMSADVDAWASFDVQPIVYTITYNLNGGTNSLENPATYTVETETIQLADPTRAGYNFVAWVNEESTDVQAIVKGSTGDMLLTAQWTTQQVFCVTYYDAYGEARTVRIPEGAQLTVEGESQVITGDVVVPACTDNPDEGYSSVGYAMKRDADNNVTLYKESANPIEYTITYNLDGGTNNAANPATYTVEDQVTLEDPSKDGVLFAGWVDDEGAAVTEIAAGTTGDLVLTATWKDYPDLAQAVISGLESSYTYTGRSIKPEFTVTVDDETLEQGTQYEVSYSNNITLGTATITITSMEGATIGTVTKTFKIVEPSLTDSVTGLTVSGVGLANITPEGGSLQLSVTEVVSGYVSSTYNGSLYKSYMVVLTQSFADGTTAEVSTGFDEVTVTVPVGSAYNGEIPIVLCSYYDDSGELVSSSIFGDYITNGTVTVTVKGLRYLTITTPSNRSGGISYDGSSGNSNGIAAASDSNSSLNAASNAASSSASSDGGGTGSSGSGTSARTASSSGTSGSSGATGSSGAASSSTADEPASASDDASEAATTSGSGNAKSSSESSSDDTPQAVDDRNTVAGIVALVVLGAAIIGGALGQVLLRGRAKDVPPIDA